jgi:hypothetical protein
LIFVEHDVCSTKIPIVEHMRYHSSTAHSAYIDLLRQLKDAAASDIRGTPTLARRGARSYWYDSYRIGNEVHKRYIGEDNEEIRSRIHRAETLRTQSESGRSERARLVRLLRSEGVASIDASTGSLLSTLAAAGVFRLGGTLVGTQAFRLYEGELGVRLSQDDAAQTKDVDIASYQKLSLAIADVESQSVRDALSGLQFEPVPTIEPAKSWRWKQTRGELLVEFLTPSFEESETAKPLPALGVHAQSLHFLNFLIATPVVAAIVYRSGVLVNIPRPERFAIHKLIVANRRRDGANSLKAVKDRQQARILIEILTHDRPEDLAEALADARDRGKKWREHIDRSLKRMPESANLLSKL